MNRNITRLGIAAVAGLALAGCTSPEQEAINEMEEHASEVVAELESEWAFMDGEEAAPTTPLAPYMTLSEYEAGELLPAWNRNPAEEQRMHCGHWRSSPDLAVGEFVMSMDVERDDVEAFFNEVCS